MKKASGLLIIAVALITTNIAMAADEGHCNYTQENMFAGPFKVCDMPADAAACEELGKTDDNADAVYNAGACPVEDVVGTCDMGETKRVYYEGDSSALEIGCGFQRGEWVEAG